MAKATGLGASTVKRAERHPWRARRATITLLAAALDVDPAAIFPGRDAAP